jgi:hypothetical protein
VRAKNDPMHPANRIASSFAFDDERAAPSCTDTFTKLSQVVHCLECGSRGRLHLDSVLITEGKFKGLFTLAWEANIRHKAGCGGAP